MKLTGITVLDFTQFMTGPMVSAIMADHGANVIKVEPPQGDPTRQGPRSLAGQNDGDTFRVLNRGKHSLVLDLKEPTHLETARALIRDADVVLESFRPGVADRLGIGYADANALNPNIVYCSISAFGQIGLLKDVAAHDTMVQALAGALAIDADGRPVEPTVSLAGVAAAHFALSATLMALLAARAGQGGDHIDISMHDAALAVRGGATAAALATLETPSHFAGPAVYALNASYRTAEGRWLRVDARDRRAATTLLEALSRPDLLPGALDADPPAQAALSATLTSIFAEASLDDWMHRLGLAGGVAPVLNYAEALAHPHTASRGLIGTDTEGGKHLHSPIRFLRDPSRPDFTTPELGQHTDWLKAAAGASPG
jgi:crotonobetainyl-CoA:carnitine CoA-transferase CaiB-like acyl-CoA transferase